MSDYQDTKIGFGMPPMNLAALGAAFGAGLEGDVDILGEDHYVAPQNLNPSAPKKIGNVVVTKVRALPQANVDHYRSPQKMISAQYEAVRDRIAARLSDGGENEYEDDEAYTMMAYSAGVPAGHIWDYEYREVSGYGETAVLECSSFEEMLNDTK